MTFGAVDIIVSDGGLPFVLEVNTGPGLVVSGLRAYAERFASLLGIEELDESVFDIVDGDEEEAHDEAPEAGEID
ncbi:MAG: hypothetical protein KOO63_02930 [Bacteroidales bacterium]|nr:hypothetical protein [Candidatus Latescibacterota bacterium]